MLAMPGGDADSVGSDDDLLSQEIQDEIAEATVRIIWNVSRAGASSTNAALLREGGVAAALSYCSYDGSRIQVSHFTDLFSAGVCGQYSTT